MNLKIPAKRIFGDNFDPGECWREGRLDLIGSGPSAPFFHCATSATTEFIKQRRAGLHEFIKRIVSHPDLCNQ